MSISPFPLSSPPRFRAVASFPTMAEAIAAAAPRRRGHSRRRPQPSSPLHSVHSGESRGPARSLPSALQRLTRINRAPVAAASSAPASSAVPATFPMPRWMRSSAGCRWVVPARFPAACSAFRRSTAARFGHRRPTPVGADVAAYLVLNPLLITPLETDQWAPGLSQS